MLPLFFVLLAAHSALCVPVYNGEQVTVNAIDIQSAPQPNINTPGGALTAFFDRYDGGERGVYAFLAQNNINELAQSGDRNAQALAYLQAIAFLGEFSTGSSGNACDYNNVLNSYAQYLQSGNSGALNSALSNFVSVFGQKIQQISAYVRNPESQKNVAPRSGNCGRSYAFNTVWGGITQNAASPSLEGLLNEQSCTARRLSNAFRNSYNNLGSALAASAIFGTSAPNFAQAAGALANFVANPASSAAASQLVQALNRVA